jgi:YesN/AraC family two-component response regulator
MALKCIIVEDSAFIREIYHYSLREHSQFIEIIAEASDGIAAIKLISDLKPDILILDLVLPLKNGIDILAQMNEISPNTKTIVISSLEDEATMNKAKALGAIFYLKKPFTKKQLIGSLEEMSKDYSEVKNG